MFEVSLAAGRPTPAAEIEEMLWIGDGFLDGVELAPLTRDEILPRYLGQR